MKSNKSSAMTSSSLLYRVKRNDEQAWDRLVTIYSPLVFHWCHHDSGLSSDDSADVMQEVFRSVAKSIASFRKEATGTFRGWLRTIAGNKIRDLIRKRRTHANAVGGTAWQGQLRELPESDPEESESAENGLIMRRAMELLEGNFKPQSRQAFLLVVIEGYTAAESAEELEMTEPGVWQACYRIRRRLREELADLFDG